MPENYHGEISYSFDLKSTAYTVDPIAGTTTPIFNAKSETDTITTTVVPQAEPAADQAVLSILIGDDAYSDAVDAEARSGSTRTLGAWSTFPGSMGRLSRSSRPSLTRTDRLDRTDRRRSHGRNVTISNIPGGMTVLVETAHPRGRELRRGHDRGRPLNQPLSLTLTASEALLSSQFGLTDQEPDRSDRTGHERDGDGQVIASAQGDEVAVVDIGAAYRANVSARPSRSATRTSRHCR